MIGDAVKKHLKVNLVSINTHAHSDAMSGIRAMDETETAQYQAHIEAIYDRFVSLVAESRGKTREAVDEIAQGRVWAGRDAIGIGLVDEFGTLLDAVHYAAEKAGLKSYRIACYPARKKGLKAILSDDGTPPELDGSFDVFVGNPPYYSDYRIADVFLATAVRALKTGGTCYTVVKNDAGLKPVQERHFPSVCVVHRRGYCVLRSVRGEGRARQC